jgi:hypothetical protein
MSDTTESPAHAQCLMTGCPKGPWADKEFCYNHWSQIPSEQRRIINWARENGRGKAYSDSLSDALVQLKSEKPVAEKTALITGRTFPVKDKLKGMGGFWSPEENGWRVPIAMKMAAQVLVGNAEQFETLPFGEEFDQ